MGLRHGHGTIQKRETSSLYIGAWKEDTRNGYGLFDNIEK